MPLHQLYSRLGAGKPAVQRGYGADKWWWLGGSQWLHDSIRCAFRQRGRGRVWLQPPGMARRGSCFSRVHALDKIPGKSAVFVGMLLFVFFFFFRICMYAFGLPCRLCIQCLTTTNRTDVPTWRASRYMCHKGGCVAHVPSPSQPLPTSTAGWQCTWVPGSSA